MELKVTNIKQFLGSKLIDYEHDSIEGSCYTKFVLYFDNGNTIEVYHTLDEEGSIITHVEGN